MDSRAGASSQRRAFPRVPLRAKVRMEFAEQRCFLSEWAVNLSPGGMFVRSESAVAPGQRFHFEAGLTPKGPRFEGLGEVTWVRQEWEGNARPPGFAVRFLELQQDGIDAMQRLAEAFLDKGVGAMQEELQAMSAAWQRRHLDDDGTEELPPAEEADEPLPDTVVLPAPWVAVGGGPELGVLPEVEPSAAGEEGAAAVDPERQVTAPLVVERTAEPAAAEDKPPAPGRRRVWWVGGLVLLLAGSGYFVLRGPLAGRLAGAPARAAENEALLSGVPRALPAGLRPGPAPFGGLDDVSWSEGDGGLWVVLALDGALPAGALRRVRFAEDHPREVVQLLGARRGYTPALLPVGSPLLDQIRVGFHPTAESGSEVDELWVVLDLPSPAVVVRSVLADGRSLRLLLGRDEAASAGLATAARTASAAAPVTAGSPAAAPQ